MTQTPYLAGQFLIAMPTMPDVRFSRSVIYVCAHNEEGAMGLVINRLIENVDFAELLEQLNITPDEDVQDVPIHFGGPVESGRGFVLHSTDYSSEGTMEINEDVSLTATVDILKALAEGKGPEKCLLALGYAGWASGQLDAELHSNGWLHTEGDPSILFDDQVEDRWERILAVMGINPAMISSESGHA